MISRHVVLRYCQVLGSLAVLGLVGLPPCAAASASTAPPPRAMALPSALPPLTVGIDSLDCSLRLDLRPRAGPSVHPDNRLQLTMPLPLQGALLRISSVSLSRLRSDRQYNDLPVIMLTAKSMEEDKIAGLDNGADDYVTKPFSPRELTARINALLRRKTPEHAQSVMSAGTVKLDPVSCNVSIAEQRIDIGHAEFKLLKFFLAHPDRVFSRSQLLDKVWGDHVVIEERTVDVHVLRLRKALKEAEYLIKTVRSVGYMLSEK